MKFRRSRSSGSYSVNPPQGETGEVAYSVKDDKHDGKYTLIDKETMSLPNTPRMSLRETVRQSLRKLKKGKQKKEKLKAKRKTSNATYEVSVSYNKKGNASEGEDDGLENDDGENPIVLKKHKSRKPSLKNNDDALIKDHSNEANNQGEHPSSLFDIVQKTKVDKTKTQKHSNSISNQESLLSEIANEVEIDQTNPSKDNSFKCFPEISDTQTFLSRTESSLIPRGPLGELLKQKNPNKPNTVEQVIIHNESNEKFEDKSEYKVEHLEIENEEMKWVEEISPKSDDEDMTITSKMLSTTSQVEKHKTPAIVTHTRPSGSSAELSLRLDEIVFLHRRLNSSWYLGEKRGVMGLIPAAFIKIIVDSEPGNESVRALATRTYNKRSQAELALEPGQLVYLTHRVDYHWYLAQAGGSKGLVPAAYLEIISSSSDGSLPHVPSYAIKERSTDDNSYSHVAIPDKDKEERAAERKGRRRRSQGKAKKKDDSSVRNQIMKNLSKRNEPILFV